jgi:hypothetical protein
MAHQQKSICKRDSNRRFSEHEESVVKKTQFLASYLPAGITVKAICLEVKYCRYN